MDNDETRVFIRTPYGAMSMRIDTFFTLKATTEKEQWSILRNATTNHGKKQAIQWYWENN